MGISLKPGHLRRYKDIAKLLLKYGRSDAIRSSGLQDAIGEEGPVDDGDRAPEAKDLAADLERMGPTFIKIGQLLSTRPDILPLPYLEALSRLQNNVAPFPFDEVERIVTTEIGVKLSRGFGSFDEKPLACASLGQVHRATLRDGRPVAVKVQRPGIRERLTEDLEALAEVAEFVDARTDFGRRYETSRMVEEFRRSLFRELDYREEARNLETLARNLAEFDRLVVPRPVADYTSAHVLTMDFIEGGKVTALDPLSRAEERGVVLGEQLFRAYLKQILVDGFLHADPHPGNVILTPDGRLGILDLGMVTMLKPELQRKLLRMLLAVSEGDGEQAAEAALAMAEEREHADRPRFEREIFERVSRHRDARIEDIELGRVILETVRLSANCGIRFPPEIGMVGQTLLKLDNLGRILAPGFRPNDSIRQNALRSIGKGMEGGFTLTEVFRTAMEAKEFFGKLPGRVNRILDSVAENKVEIGVRAFDETRMIAGMQKIANRITLGLVLAALIVGAALLMRVETPFRILGYPGLAVLSFAGAAGAGLVLAARIVWSDEHPGTR